MEPLARSEIHPLKLGRYPGRREAMTYRPCRGYFNFRLPCGAFFFFFFFFTYPAVRLCLFMLSYSAVPFNFFFLRFPCCAFILIFAYPAVALFLFSLTLLWPYFCCALTLLSRCALIFLRTYY